MFKSVRVQNFQSLRDVTVPLAPFTVIVGQTDSGKSAFFRSMATLISNRRGADFITYGERICTITAEMDQGKLVLQRGKATADNFYEITVEDKVDTYTKLSGTVPEEVSAFLKIPAKDPINFASQFDKPYLLDTKEYSAADSARILGALTNVNLLFEGARESNRRKTEAATRARTRVADAETVAERLKGYEGLADKEAHLASAEESAATAQKLEAVATRVSMLLEVWERSEVEVEELRTQTEVEVPDISGIEKLHKATELLNSVLTQAEESYQSIGQLDKVISETELEVTRLDSEYQAVLKREGTCPICGQTT